MPAPLKPTESKRIPPRISNWRARQRSVRPRSVQKKNCKRILPVIVELKKKHPKAVLSVDTYKATVARAAVGAGVEIVNDVSGFRWDPQMAKTIAELKCGAVLMHMRGRPEEWRTLPPPGDIVLLVKRELKEWAEKAVLAGVRRERIVIDPGFGFGKNYDENYPLLARFSDLQTPDSLCWRAHRESLSSGTLWPRTGRTRLQNSAFTEHSPLRPRSF